MPSRIQAQFYRGNWAWILDGMGWPRAWFEGLRGWHVLPEAFLYGFAFVIQFSRERAAFLNGDYSMTGWATFFPFSFAVKSTLPFLLLLGTATVTKISRARTGRDRGVDFTTLWPLTPLI